MQALFFSVSAMHAAAAAGHASTVQLLIRTGGSTLVEATDLSKRTPLSRACEMGRAAVVETLIDNGARVNDVKDHDGQSLLHWSVLFRYFTIVS
jgi:ankyrin repeat protein